MPAIYSSADFMLQASLREFSGCAILEGMACGAIPAISDIPSFRMMTGSGRVGILFPIGDAEALARQILAIPADSIEQQAQATRGYFEANLSFRAMALQLEQVYQELVSVGVTAP
jgi:glycosyltransferase involved in cell wall biosynthesis